MKHEIDIIAKESIIMSINDNWSKSNHIKKVEERRLILKDLYCTGLIDEEYYKKCLTELLASVK